MATYLLIEGELNNGILLHQIFCDSNLLLESCGYGAAYNFLSQHMKQGDILYEVSTKGNYSQPINVEIVLQGNYLMNPINDKKQV
ncbi:MAG: hypothetical protein OT477_02575 [Chloroflexi bacterium]|nr:hypothetical protein [Chloroflexota bacterium]